MDKIYEGKEKPLNSGVVNIGKKMPDGRHALYATFPNRIVPKEWCGFPVIDTIKTKYRSK